MQKLKQFPSLYFILDPSVCKNQHPIKIATETLKGGVKLLQLRDKSDDIRKKLELAKKIQTLCKSYNATFIINDHIDIALTLSTDGLHLGQTDFPFLEAKELLGPNKILGTSNVTLEQAIESEKQGSDYIAIGDYTMDVALPDGESPLMMFRQGFSVEPGVITELTLTLKPLASLIRVGDQYKFFRDITVSSVVEL